MDAPLTEYALRDGIHVGYQVWGPAGAAADDMVDVLEFNSGLMISIDETVDEPNWLRYTERVADFSRLIRFDAGGLGLSDPLPPGTEPSIERWGLDALAVMDAERVAALVLVNGTARVGQAQDYGFGISDADVLEGASIEVPLTADD